MRKEWLILLICFYFNGFSQEYPIENSRFIKGFFLKLDSLESGKLDKVRITHIGDSHIQADFFTGSMRQRFQNRFGNGGYGFSFPYKLAKTNGTGLVKYTSNATFIGTRAMFAKDNMPVGLSAYAMTSKTKNTAIKIKINPDYACNKITLITPNPNDFYFANYDGIIAFDKFSPKEVTKNHIVKGGESLYIIARKYKTTVKKIQVLNHLKGNMIHPKQKLKIAVKSYEPVHVSPNNFEKLLCSYDTDCVGYHTNEKQKEFYLFNANTSKNLAINGFVLENDTSGIIYNAIGVNGIKASTYNKFPMFFEQLKELNSDLIIVSLGTNESFDTLDGNLFITRFLEFIANLRKANPNQMILVTTPPASFFKRTQKNPFTEKYITAIKGASEAYHYAVWDLYHAYGGQEAIRSHFKAGLMAKDRVHYTKAGYEQQADLFFNAITANFNN